MASGTKYFILNRSSDWQENSFIENLDFKDDMMVSKDDTSENGLYISSSFDSGNVETVWHRLRLDLESPQNTQVRIKIYANDSLEIDIPDGIDYGNSSLMMLDEYLLNEDIPSATKLNVLNEIGAKTFDNPSDLVLYEFTGRYLWICIETISYSDEITKIKKLKLEFPRISFVDYLPQIYRGGTDKNTFLARFISIFQSIYVDFEDRIDRMPMMFDPQKVDSEFLEWLTDWFLIKNSYIWSEEKLRDLLRKCVTIYKKKGTKKALQQMIEMYIESTPIIVEQFSVVDNDYYRNSKEHIQSLFGSNQYTFSVIINTDDNITSETYVELLRIINMMKPIDSICNLVILNNEIYLDHHCYLGINTYASKSENIVLENNSENDLDHPVFLKSTQNI